MAGGDQDKKVKSGSTGYPKALLRLRGTHVDGVDSALSADADTGDAELVGRRHGEGVCWTVGLFFWRL